MGWAFSIPGVFEGIQEVKDLEEVEGFDRCDQGVVEYYVEEYHLVYTSFG